MIIYHMIIEIVICLLSHDSLIDKKESIHDCRGKVIIFCGKLGSRGKMGQYRLLSSCKG